MDLKEKNLENINNDDIKNDNIDENNTTVENTSLVESSPGEFIPVNKEGKKHNPLSIFSLLVGILLIIILLGFSIFTVYNIFNGNIITGVSIKNIDVSNMSTSDAKYTLDNYFAEKLPEEIKVKHGDFEGTISISQIEASFDTKNAVNSAFNVGRQGNIFQNNLYVLSTMFGKINIEPNVKLNKEQLSKNLEEMSAQLPDKVEESSYYIDGSNLIVTAGKQGNVVDVEKSIEIIKNAISSLSTLSEPIELAVKTQEPASIDIEKIHNEIYKEAKDAYYTQNPFTVYPSENGVDFNISIEEAKNIISDNSKSEYTIPLKILAPNVTTNMIGTEAFPDLLSTFSTNYAVSNRNRTTNLILAANKINGTVLMPGETFSYNKVVGARTISAGYKEAPIYVQGEVVDGLGGGICQISTTLYNTVLMSDLKVTERKAHMMHTGYNEPGKDATVVYGSIDFRFVNNRKTPIKISMEVKNGVVTSTIYGLKMENEPIIEIKSVILKTIPYTTIEEKDATMDEGTTKVVQSPLNGYVSETYRIEKDANGKEISRKLISKDTYKQTSKIIKVGTKKVEKPVEPVTPVEPTTSEENTSSLPTGWNNPESPYVQ